MRIDNRADGLIWIDPFSYDFHHLLLQTITADNSVCFFDRQFELI